VEAQLEEARGLLEVAARTVTKAWEGFSETVAEKRGDLLEHAHVRRAEAAKAFEANLDSLAAALSTLSDAAEAERLLLSWPQKVRWNPRAPLAPALVARSGEPFTAVEVLGALAAIFEPPSPIKPVVLGGINVEQLEAQAADEPELELGASHTSRAPNLVR
jgi:hypothetical protein